MAKEPLTDSDGDQPTSETARVAIDLMEMMREMCFHSRDTRNKRTKITQMIDNLLRPAVTKAYEEFQQKQKQSSEEASSSEAKPKPRKPRSKKKED